MPEVRTETHTIYSESEKFEKDLEFLHRCIEANISVSCFDYNSTDRLIARAARRCFHTAIAYLDMRDYLENRED